MLVIDASVLAVALVDDGPDGDQVRDLHRGESLAAPSLIDLEVLSVWRGLTRRGHLEARRADLALADLQAIPNQRVDHTALWRCWELRDNLTMYDAACVAWLKRSRSSCSPETNASPGHPARTARSRSSRPNPIALTCRQAAVCSGATARGVVMQVSPWCLTWRRPAGSLQKVRATPR